MFFRRRAELHERLKNSATTQERISRPLLREELWPLVDIYEDLKRRAGRLDFLDLLLVARNPGPRQRGGPRGIAGSLHA